MVRALPLTALSSPRSSRLIGSPARRANAFSSEASALVSLTKAPARVRYSRSSSKQNSPTTILSGGNTGAGGGPRRGMALIRTTNSRGDRKHLLLGTTGSVLASPDGPWKDKKKQK